MAQYAVVNIFKFKDGRLLYSADDSTWEPVDAETITGYPKQNELMVWFAGSGVKRIISLDFLDLDDFKRPPKAKFKGRLWVGKIKKDAIIGNEPKYSITFEAKDGEVHTVDPKLKIKGE